MFDDPMTPGDLRAIAGELEQLETIRALVHASVCGRVEVYRPDSDQTPDDLVGYFQTADTSEDGWVGFVPRHPEPVPLCPDCGHLQHSLHLIYRGRIAASPHRPRRARSAAAAAPADQPRRDSKP